MLDLILNFTYNDLRCDSGLESEFGISAADNGRLTFAYTQKRQQTPCLLPKAFDFRYTAK